MKTQLTFMMLGAVGVAACGNSHSVVSPSTVGRGAIHTASVPSQTDAPLLVMNTAHGVPGDLCGNTRETLLVCQTRCNEGQGSQCSRLAVTLGWTGPFYSPTEAGKYALRGCELKDPAGCGLVGVAYANPNSPTRNLALAERYGVLACSMGVAPSCFMLTEMYRVGTRPESAAKALEYTRYGCFILAGRSKRCCAIEEFQSECMKAEDGSR
jgi:hypothetical protein